MWFLRAASVAKLWQHTSQYRSPPAVPFLRRSSGLEIRCWPASATYASKSRILCTKNMCLRRDGITTKQEPHSRHWYADRSALWMAMCFQNTDLSSLENWHLEHTIGRSSPSFDDSRFIFLLGGGRTSSLSTVSSSSRLVSSGLLDVISPSLDTSSDLIFGGEGTPMVLVLIDSDWFGCLRSPISSNDRLCETIRCLSRKP